VSNDNRTFRQTRGTRVFITVLPRPDATWQDLKDPRVAGEVVFASVEPIVRRANQMLWCRWYRDD
jgi:hypothetical protein